MACVFKNQFALVQCLVVDVDIRGMPRSIFTTRRSWFAVAALGLAVFFVWGWWATAPPAEGHIADNVFVGNISLGGLSVPAAEQVLQNRLDELKSGGLAFVYDGQRVVINPTTDPTDDPDVVRELVDIDISATVQRAYAVGRVWRLGLSRPRMMVPAFVAIREKDLFEAIFANFPDLEKPSVEPAFIIDEETKELTAMPESRGQRLNKNDVVKEMKRSLESLSNTEVTLSVTTEKPQSTQEEVLVLVPKVKEILAKLPFEIIYEDQNWQLNQAEVLPYLIVIKKDNSLALGLRRGFIDAVLQPISKEVSRSVSAARFKMENGKVTVWQPPLDGREVDIESTLSRLEDYLNNGTSGSIELVVKVEPAPSIDGEGRDLGIREIIGVGKSNFKGSPKNRRHNIKVGADTLNGILIAPNEEFSLVKALGAIDASTGYLQELVIKGNRTIPEFGGGLCQIGTTIFRAALASGLPILERQNHSYRVRYYEPAGTDATIYGPKPDFRFLNDTGASILIQTKIKGDDLIFEFWGTKDGRQVFQTTPRIYNIAKPPPKKIIPTTELPEGEEKCTEKAHDGADTEFTYTVIYTDGIKKEKVFKSHYRPWQEVCLLGVKELPATPPAAESPAESDDGVSGADSPAAVTPPSI